MDDARKRPKRVSTFEGFMNPRATFSKNPLLDIQEGAELLRKLDDPPKSEQVDRSTGGQTSEHVDMSAGEQVDTSTCEQTCEHVGRHVNRSTPEQVVPLVCPKNRQVDKWACGQVETPPEPPLHKYKDSQRKVIEFLSKLPTNLTQYEDIMAATGLAYGTVRGSMQRLKGKGVLDFGFASDDTWRGIGFRFLEKGLRMVTKTEQVDRWTSGHVNRSTGKQVNRSTPEQVSRLIDRPLPERSINQDGELPIDNAFLARNCPVQYEKGLRVELPEFLKAMEEWRKRGLDFGRLGRSLEILEDRYRKDKSIATANYTCEALARSGYPNPMKGWKSPEQEFDEGLRAVDEELKAAQAHLEALKQAKYKTWLLETPSDKIEQLDAEILEHLEKFHQKRFNTDKDFKHKKRYEYFCRKVLDLPREGFLELGE